jgi:hypothetical protein
VTAVQLRVAEVVVIELADNPTGALQTVAVVVVKFTGVAYALDEEELQIVCT